MFVIELAILIYSVVLHEVAHGYVAERLGDPTARAQRRLTLNPLPHIDPIYTIILPLILLVSGAGIIFGAAKPVPVDPFNFRDPKKDTAIVSLAGPLTNILIAGAFSILYRLYPVDVFITAIQLNIGLAVFNLIPIPPLDGSKILAGVLSDNIAEAMYRLQNYGLTLIFFILFFIPGLIQIFTGPLTRILYKLLLP
ncbi:hypothetical protein A2872_04025 [Candidatus Gottesmanbacteria bacterium RIFCSPHIGHO2_01_FULL_42_12]|uniref:Peptidase M50 domain-containing protein n=1 Tax=Candidatus Gottesmanbacteria bacterium RIFCSPHIGHO2_01_FULL_42_12 TaxID=1798377 RepID=A0A1F5Z3Y4_9BACT|nr:MAG: hypothetical protein A2872_04025 [Candidatus Gottesmanbacteria bacterium RIFCSPHIGHO2_01_FULL_42_12]